MANSPIPLLDGKVLLALPPLAADPVDLSDNLAVIKPRSDRPDLKYVIYVVRELLRAEEAPLANEDLKTEVERILKMAGFHVIGLTCSNDTFFADFRAVIAPGTLPWQKVGPGIARGKAKFVRTTGGELIGSVLLCDPSQWKDETTRSFINVVEDSSVVP